MSSTERVAASDDDEEARHRAAEARVESFGYRRPALPPEANKGLVKLCATGILKGIVQVIEEGGENTLHYHDGMDSFWMVLKGRVRFYGPGDKLIGEYGPLEGLTTPAGARYWFEKASDEALELLQVAGYDPQAGARRVALSAGRPATNRNQWFDGQRGNAPIDKTQA